MGHLLSTVNKEASAAMDRPIERRALPPTGMTVIYTMRPGHGRMGTNKFPAIVMGSDNQNRLNLLVMIDAGDMMDEQMVEQAKPGNEFHCWDWVDDASAAVQGMRGTMAALHQRIGDQEERLKALEAVVLGDYAPPKVSIIGIMVDFENRLRLSASRAADTAAPLGTPTAKFPAKRGPKKGAKKRK